MIYQDHRLQERSNYPEIIRIDPRAELCCYCQSGSFLVH